MFGPVARTSFQGQIKQAIPGIVEAKTSPVTAAMKAAAGVADKVKGVNEASKFKAIKELLSQ